MVGMVYGWKLTAWHVCRLKVSLEMRSGKRPATHEHSTNGRIGSRRDAKRLICMYTRKEAKGHKEQSNMDKIRERSETRWLASAMRKLPLISEVCSLLG